MSCDAGEIKDTKKCRKKTSFSSFFRTIFGCAGKGKSLVEPVKSYSSIAVQCHLQIDLRTTDFNTETLLVGSNSKLEVTTAESDVCQRKEDPLKKIDDLINALNEIKGLCNSKTLQPLEGYEGENEVFKELSLDLPEGEEGDVDRGVKFNRNIDENALIQCHTNRGKHSLKIIQNSGQKNYNPLILHRCESDYVLTKNPKRNFKSKFMHRKSSSDTRCQQIDHHLQRNHTISPERVGNSFLNFSLFKSNVIMHMGSIKEDVKALRRILYNIECMVKNGERGILPVYVEEIKKWFSVRPEIDYSTRDSDLDEHERELGSNKFVEAKIRAATFCKFYTLTKVYKKKSTPRRCSKS